MPTGLVARGPFAPAAMRPLSLAPISGRRRPLSDVARWAAPSVAVHALFVAATLVNLIARASDDERPAHEVLFLAPLLPRSEASPAASQGNGAGGVAIGYRSGESTSEGTGEAMAGTPGTPEGTSHSTSQAQQDLAEPPTPDPASAGDEHIYQAVDVDREVTRSADAVAPLYPEQLRLTGITGGVTVRFVVDTIGNVEEGSLFVIGATHPLFAAAVRDAAPSMRFQPAIRSGRVVRQQVIQSFQFVLTATGSVPTQSASAKP